jgi:hypothetical protein
MTVADTKPLLEVRGVTLRFPVTDLKRTMRPRLGEPWMEPLLRGDGAGLLTEMVG